MVENFLIVYKKKMVYQNHYHHSERETNVAEPEPGFLSGTRADYSNFDFLLLLLIKRKQNLS